MKDYSEYLNRPGNLAWIEQQWGQFPITHYFHAHIVNEAIEKYGLDYVIEFGCGIGHLASKLKAIDYTGIDSNEDCIRMAKERNPDRYFQIGNIREAQAKKRNDLVFCFGFLKHFGLHEWFDIFNLVSSYGEYFIFDMPIGETKDDGVEYHHVWKSIDDLLNDIKEIGFVVLKKIQINKDEICFITKYNGIQS